MNSILIVKQEINYHYVSLPSDFISDFNVVFSNVFHVSVGLSGNVTGSSLLQHKKHKRIRKKQNIFSNCTIANCSISLVKFTMSGLFIIFNESLGSNIKFQLLILLKDGL